MTRERYRFAYFGYEVEFWSDPKPTAELRARANGIVLAVCGESPALDYVEPGLPFPDYVPCDVFDIVDGEPRGWCCPIGIPEPSTKPA